MNNKDAPGYGTGLGPICWKCRGEKIVTKKRKRTSTNKTKTATNTIASPINSTTTTKCTVCKGKGRLPIKTKEANAATQPGRITQLRDRPSVWLTNLDQITKQRLSLQPVGNPNNIPRLAPANGEELTGLVGDFRIFQKVGGHRWSTEDLCTGYYANQICREMNIVPHKILDLGTGLASVALSCKWLWPNAEIVGIEAQPTSFGLAQRSVEYNTGSTNGLKLINADIRDHVVLASVASSTQDEKKDNDGVGFDLVTGTPPYFKLDDQMIPLQGGMPSCINSAPARNEFRGGIEIYCEAAAKTIKANKPIVITMAYQLERVIKAGKAAGLKMVRRLEVCGKVGKRPLFACFCFVKNNLESQGDGDEEKDCLVETIYVRGLDNQRTKEYNIVLETMGIPP